MIDDPDDVLAEAYDRALALEKSGRIDEAAAVYRQVLTLDPADHAGAAVRLAAMGRGDVPPKAPDAYVATLFDQHADVFDVMLVDQLGYSVPLQVRQLIIDRALGPFERMLDLGCGTGLSGEALRDQAGHLTGVDVSENMVEIAHDKEVYEALYVAEAVRFLQDTEDAAWDLIVATDVLPYLGGVDDLFAGIAARIESGGLFVFSTETLPDELFDGRSFMVGPKQRFAHCESYIRASLAGHGFECLLMQPITVRYDEGEPIHGHLVLAQNKAG
jgi:predicted TPR repeat methyltransferase